MPTGVESPKRHHRVRNCMAQRGRFPNLIGVNFYDKGDLLRVVNEVNGVDGTR